MDALYVPSMVTGNELEKKGIPKEKIRFYPRGIDIDRFHLKVNPNVFVNPRAGD